MAIMKSDGSILKLQHPNKLTTNQIVWKDKVILHNFDKKNVEPTVNLKQVVNSLKTFPEDIKEEKITYFKPKNEPEIQQDPEIKPQPKEELKNIVIFYCLPVKERDNLYSEIRYGKKFTFEAVIIETGDLFMSLWTNLNLSQDSIIYPSKYKNGDTLDEFRWWKINSNEQYGKGWIYESIISDVHPDFSD